MDMFRILHIIKDDKFFDDVFELFERESQLQNFAVLKVGNVENYQFRRIKNTGKVKLETKKDVSRTICKGEYDALFFHSLPIDCYEYARWIPKDKIVICWCWGYDIYESYQGLEPLIKVKTLKPKTEKLLEELGAKVSDEKRTILKKTIARLYYGMLRNKMIKRIDYFQPVIPPEYELMHTVEGFSAKEFYFPHCFGDFVINKEIIKHPQGGILIGNSQSPNNNHLDVWEYIHDYIPEGRIIIIPINYLGNLDYANEISVRIKSEKHRLMFLKEFLPIDEYYELIGGCSYAIFGAIRQHAMGNVYTCLRNGLKLFFFKDSMIYNFLNNRGFVVYAIEEVDDNSFKKPLTKDDVLQNANAYERLKQHIESVGTNALTEIISSKKVL